MVLVECPPMEIAASPEHVRDVILDFANLQQWHTAHFKFIKVVSGKNPKDLVPGDKLNITLAVFGVNFTPVIKVNTPTRLQWLGSVPGIFNGDHVFEMHPSKITPGHTTFIHTEDFTGALSFTMKIEKKSGRQNMEGFETFNADLKRKCEEGR